MSDNNDSQAAIRTDIDLGKKVETFTQVPYDEAYNALRRGETISCTYLIYLGTVSEIAHAFEFTSELPSDAFVCKFGKSEDFCRRLHEHNRDYGGLIGLDVQLMYYMNMPQEKISDSEKIMLGKFCENGMRQILKDKNGTKRKEIIVFRNTVINAKQIMDIFTEAKDNAKSERKKPVREKQMLKIDPETKRYICRCGKRYSYKHGLKRHASTSKCGSKRPNVSNENMLSIEVKKLKTLLKEKSAHIERLYGELRIKDKQISIKDEQINELIKKLTL